MCGPWPNAVELRNSGEAPFYALARDRYVARGLDIALLKGWKMMTKHVASGSSARRSALVAIGVGGTSAGALDLIQASVLFGWKIPLSIAGGLIGPNARSGGPGTYLLGVFLHF